jgi:hypothetical protein
MTHNTTRKTLLASAALLATLAFVNTPATAAATCIGDIVVVHAVEIHAVESRFGAIEVGSPLVETSGDGIESRTLAFRGCGGGGGNPPNPDRDGDGYTNNQEVAQGTNPDDANSFPDNKWTDAECDAWEAEHPNGAGPEECRGR